MSEDSLPFLSSSLFQGLTVHSGVAWAPIFLGVCQEAGRLALVLTVAFRTSLRTCLYNGKVV